MARRGSSAVLAPSDREVRELERRAKHGNPADAEALERARSRRTSVWSRPADTFASRVGAELGHLWAEVRARHQDLPPAVVVLASGSEGKIRKWGHWGAGRWDVAGDRAGEVLIAGELLAPGSGHEPDRPVEQRVLATVLHEAAHALAYVRGIADTSRGARYHNRRYRALAEEVGLRCDEEAGLYGWALTRLAAGTPERYEGRLTSMRQVLTGFRASEPGAGGEEQGERPAKAPGRVRVECSCARVAYVAAGVLELGPIVCGVCDEEFHAG